MITDFRPRVTLEKVPPALDCVYVLLEQAGDRIGKLRYREEWESMKHPSSKKLRIWKPPQYADGVLDLSVSGYPWSQLQEMRQLQPVGRYGADSPITYVLNGIALTVNGLIETDNRKLVFHRKKGGAQPGSIHTFGGYVRRSDLGKDGDMTAAVRREMGEHTEIGLEPDEFEVTGFFGTPDGRPAILWGYGTGAVYARVRTGLSDQQLRERIQRISAEETLERELFAVAARDVRQFMERDDIHPQTRLVAPTICALYE